jgi:hypothetical protein
MNQPKVNDAAFYQRAKSFANELRHGGHPELAEGITDAIETGSTGSEILMRLRMVLSGALTEAKLNPHERQTVHQLLAEIERVL